MRGYDIDREDVTKQYKFGEGKCSWNIMFQTIHLLYLFGYTRLPRSGKNILKMKFFQVRELSGNFVDGRGNFERTSEVRKKVREFENKWLWQAVFRRSIYSV